MSVARPVLLQVRRANGRTWQTVVEFDAGDADAEGSMRSAVELLAAVDSTARFRIVVAGLPDSVLLTYDAASGWANAVASRSTLVVPA